MPGSRLLPTEQRAALPVAPTTSTWWRTQVLVRSWLNRHRQRWLAPLLVCVPPVGVAMLWAGATRPGHRRRWLTAAAGVWMIALGLMVSLLALPGASPAGAGGAPPRAGGPALPASAVPSSTPTRDPAAAAAAVRREAARSGGVAAASVSTAAPAPAAPSAGPSDPPSAPPPSSAPAAAVPAPSTPPSAASSPTHATPTPTRQPPTRAPHGPPATQPPPPPPTAEPFTPCSSEGDRAVSPQGFPLRCYRTPIGLYWLWGR